jgi:hypothetical protein
MDRTVASIITSLKAEQQELLEAMGDFPKSDQFDHGTQVGNYQGIRKALEIVESVLNDEEASNGNL